MFKPHDFKPTLFGTPTIRITEECLQDMWYLVQEVPIEVGWFCVCHEEDNGDIRLSEVLLPGQNCTAVEAEFSIAGLEELANQILTEDSAAGIKPEDDKFRYNHLNCWCHSHVDMSVGPSGQDDRQMEEFCKHWGDTFPFYVRGIMNKKGDAQWTVYYRCSKTWKPIKDCPWEVISSADPTRKEYWAKLVKERVSRPQYAHYDAYSGTAYGRKAAHDDFEYASSWAGSRYRGRK